MRVSRPLSIQIEPGTAWTLEFSARTRSKYDDNDAAATVGFGSIILWIASTCACNEDTSNSVNNMTAIGPAIRLWPVSEALLLE